MKSVVAIIRPFLLDNVRNALVEIGVSGMTIVEVMGFGRQKGRVDPSHAEYGATLLPKVKIELAVRDEDLQKVVDAISNSAKTGSVGDGKIFVAALAETIRIRTGETGDTAV